MRPIKLTVQYEPETWALIDEEVNKLEELKGILRRLYRPDMNAQMKKKAMENKIKL